MLVEETQQQSPPLEYQCKSNITLCSPEFKLKIPCLESRCTSTNHVFTPLYRILAACAIAGVASYTASALSSSSSTATPQPQTSPKAEEDPATPLQIKSHTQHIKNSRQAGYIDDHPKPVDDRHGDSVKHHSIAAEKNEHKVRTGIFSKVEFDNDVEKHSADPCNDFEKIDVEGKK